jgi:Helix-turn-helix domain, rpiR family
MLFARISEALEHLRPSERRVAEFILARPTVAAEMTIADLAGEVGVSEPTVMRFCRAIGLKGFQDMKRQVLRDLERRKAVVTASAQQGASRQPKALRGNQRLPDAGPLAELLVRQGGLTILALDAEFYALAEAATQHLARAMKRAGVVDRPATQKACLEIGDSGGGQLVRLVGAPLASGLSGRVPVLLTPPGATVFERFKLVITLIDEIDDHLTSRAGASINRQVEREQAFARSRQSALLGVPDAQKGGPGARPNPRPETSVDNLALGRETGNA